jgi:prolyl 4-hydroxylase
MFSEGECENTPDYMKLRCAPACETCELLDFNTRCPIDPDAFVAWPEPGDVNRFFERIVNDMYWEENHGPVSILSSPATGGPWVITIDNFLNDEEIKRLLEFGHEEEFERSTDVGELDLSGSATKVEGTWRTSENAW